MRMSLSFRKPTRVGLIVAFGALLTASVQAAPTAQLLGGNTRVVLDPGFLAALDSLGVVPAPIAPGTLWNGRTVRFPIPAGVVDLGSSQGDIFHAGGLSLSAGGTRVDLVNFLIDTVGTPSLTGIVSVDGAVVGRLPLFDLTLTQAPSAQRNVLRIAGVEVSLTQAAADALNMVFGIDDLSGGLPIGVAFVNAPFNVLSDGRDEDEDEDSDDDRRIHFSR